MAIQHQDDGKKGEFYYEENGSRLASMTYVWSGTDKFIIDHTEVSPVLEGRGMGKQLLNAAVNMARERGLKIMPLCPFAKRVMEKGDEYKDVLF